MTWSRLLNLLIGSAALISALAFLGAVYQAVADRVAGARYPPPGRLFDVGGYRLHVQCSGPEGAGSGPTVVLDAGIGECSLSWSPVQAEIAKLARVCSYDRAGLGWSDPAPNARTSRQIVEDLHALLQRAGIEPPYVMVGHSFGGLNVRLYAAQFPEEVAGLVMVDACHEDYPIGRFCPPHYRLGMLAAPLGIPRLFARFFVSGNPIFAADSKYPPAYRAVATGTKHLDAARREWSSVDESWEQARGAEQSLGDRPLAVLLATSEHEAFPRITELETELASRSTEGRLLMVENSGHHIQHDRPDAVVNAVREVLEAVRRKSNGGPKVKPA